MEGTKRTCEIKTRKLPERPFCESTSHPQKMESERECFTPEAVNHPLIKNRRGLRKQNREHLVFKSVVEPFAGLWNVTGRSLNRAFGSSVVAVGCSGAIRVKEPFVFFLSRCY